MRKTVKEMLAFLTENEVHINYFDLNDLFEKIGRKAFTVKTGVWTEEPDLYGRYLFDFEDEDLDYNEKRFKLWLDKNYKGDRELFNWHSTHLSLLKSYYLREGDKNNFTISSIGSSASNFFYFLRHIKFNVKDDDWKEANDLADRLKAANYNLKDFEIGGQAFDVKVFNNGRLDIKGLTDEQDKKIRNIIQTLKRSYLKPNEKDQWTH